MELVRIDIILQYNREKTKLIDSRGPEDRTKILIVVDMLLVGYDVPIVQVM